VPISLNMTTSGVRGAVGTPLAETIKTSSSGTVDATAMATKMVDRKGPGGPHH
jgi:hypothetical protein